MFLKDVTYHSEPLYWHSTKLKIKPLLNFIYCQFCNKKHKYGRFRSFTIVEKMGLAVAGLM